MTRPATLLVITLFVAAAASFGGSTMPATSPAAVPDLSAKPWTLVEGGVVRGDFSAKRLALIFTGGDFGEGTGHVLDALKQRGIKASFFVTGDYLRKPEHADFLKRIVAEGHYLGPHSDRHALYCPWEDRKKTLVTKEFFRQDLRKNIDDLRKL